MPAIAHIDELLGSAWAWDDEDDELEGRSSDDEAPRGCEEARASSPR